MRSASLLAIATALVLAVAATAGAASPPDGHALYVRHCQRCHGIDGRGDGPDAELFATPPRNLRDGVLARYSADDLVQRIRTGKPLQLALDTPALKERARDVEALAAHLRRLPTLDWRRIELGQQVYLDRCELCHGPTGQPGPTVPRDARPPRDLADPAFQRGITDEQLTTAVRHGRTGMPPLDPPIASNETSALIAFVRLLSPGFTLYDRYCAACHGDDGRDTGELATEPHPTVVFDEAYFRRRDPEQVRAAVWHMLAEQRTAMPHLRKKVGDAEARAIVAYLKDAK
jgi:mono/diheme cytochrome c family protein